MALGFQPLTQMSTRNVSWGVKAAAALGWQPYHFHVPIVLKSWSLDVLEPFRPVQTCHGIAVTLLLHIILKLLIYVRCFKTIKLTRLI